MAAGIIGAILALGGAAALQAGGYLPALGGVEETGEVMASAEQLNALSGEVAALRDRVQGAPAAPAENGAAAEQLTALSQRIEALESSVSTTGADAAAGAQQAGDTAAAAQQTAAAAQETANAAQEAATTAQQTAGEARQTAAAAQQTAEQANAKVDEAVAQFESRIAGMEASNRRADVALAAANLKSAIDQGGPFMRQLETYAEATGAGAATEDLRAFAADGVPSKQALAAEWPAVEDAIAESLRPALPDAPVQEQLLSGLRSLVQVRPTGETAATSEGPDAALARLDAAIESGDLAGWQSEWQALPQAAKDVSQDFANRVAARRTADRVVAEALSSALAPAPAGAAGSGSPADQPTGQANQG
ncbi:COG4223 family protein [Aurantimonas marianensis]|uniref:Uncharacterized protein n=1 Tax=Aurantimonas marianensis TaxID=2920428 RepID=A0A9X2HFD7_9HYPH|nr:hypothetical protein [Aurantimonas marianensis]MCP3056584.1 hypothetical protein [Aurantimonas marianensis]